MPEYMQAPESEVRAPRSTSRAGDRQFGEAQSGAASRFSPLRQLHRMGPYRSAKPYQLQSMPERQLHHYENDDCEKLLLSVSQDTLQGSISPGRARRRPRSPIWRCRPGRMRHAAAGRPISRPRPKAPTTWPPSADGWKPSFCASSRRANSNALVFRMVLRLVRVVRSRRAATGVHRRTGNPRRG